MKYVVMACIFIMMQTNLAYSAIQAEEIQYQSGETALNGYIAYDDEIEGKRPGILIVHEWWGHNDYARKRADLLAELGYIALAVDMYGDGKLAEHPDTAGAFAGEVSKNMEEIGKNRFMAALDVLKRNSMADSQRIAAIGYCFGGGVVLHMARFGLDLDGVVSFHGSLSTESPAQPGTVKARVLVFNGADDTFVTPEQIVAFKREMENAQVDYQFVNLEGAVHSFTNLQADEFGQKFNLPLAYNKNADTRSWAGMQKFFEEIFE